MGTIVIENGNDSTFVIEIKNYIILLVKILIIWSEEKVNTKDKVPFLFVDGLEQLLKEYQDILLDGARGRHHKILFYGETGSGKSMFSGRCIEEVEEKQKSKDVYVIDLIEHLQDTNQSSDDKLINALRIIEKELLRQTGFNDLEGQSLNPEMFKYTLKRILEKINCLILIRFPKIEIFREIEKYHAYLDIENIILYFITDKEDVVSKCRNAYDTQFDYMKCKRVKPGDGKLLIENLFSKDVAPFFVDEEIESLMQIRAEGYEMTIGELSKMINNAYRYAVKNKIEKITKAIILEGAVYYGAI